VIIEMPEGYQTLMKSGQNFYKVVNDSMDKYWHFRPGDDKEESFL